MHLARRDGHNWVLARLAAFWVTACLPTHARGCGPQRRVFPRLRRRLGLVGMALGAAAAFDGGPQPMLPETLPQHMA
eukprot:5777014-Pyramimonas_sp.AAC.1